jgi:hypothetical protein
MTIRPAAARLPGATKEKGEMSMKSNLMRMLGLAAVILLVGAASFACSSDTGKTAGEAVDNAMDSTGEAVEDAGDAIKQ